MARVKQTKSMGSLVSKPTPPTTPEVLPEVEVEQRKKECIDDARKSLEEIKAEMEREEELAALHYAKKREQSRTYYRKNPEKCKLYNKKRSSRAKPKVEGEASAPKAKLSKEERAAKAKEYALAHPEIRIACAARQKAYRLKRREAYLRFQAKQALKEAALMELDPDDAKVMSRVLDKESQAMKAAQEHADKKDDEDLEADVEAEALRQEDEDESESEESEEEEEEPTPPPSKRTRRR